MSSRLDPFERAMLESGSREAPSAARRNAARAAVMRAAGVGAAIAAASLASTTAAAAAPVAEAASLLPAASAGAAKVSLLVKLVLLSAIATGVAGGAVVIAKRGDSRAAGATSFAVPIREAPSPYAARAEQVPVAVDVDALPAASAESVPSASPAAAPSAAAANVKPAAASVAVDPVAAEARLLEAARRCLAAGDGPCARAKIAEHRTRFTDGVLREEARVLEERIERLERAGEAP